jgi:apolipoprotein N-acyltransferase
MGWSLSFDGIEPEGKETLPIRGLAKSFLLVFIFVCIASTTLCHAKEGKNWHAAAVWALRCNGFGLGEGRD